MTEDLAIELVYDLIESVRQCDRREGDRYYFEIYEKARDAVITALTRPDCGALTSQERGMP